METEPDEVRGSTEGSDAPDVQTTSPEPDADTEETPEPLAKEASEDADPAQPSAEESDKPNAEADTKAQSVAVSG